MLKIATLCSLVVCCTGCASIITGGGETQSVRFTSKPRGAKVFVDDDYVGVTPTASALTRKDDHFVRMELGGQVKTEDLHSGVNPWILGNILLGGIIGLVVDGVSGAFMWPGAGEVSKEFTVSEPSFREERSQRSVVHATPTPIPPRPILGSDGKPFRTNND